MAETLGADPKILVHDLRKQVDACIRDVNYFRMLPYKENPLAQGLREVKLAYTKLQEAKMWLGKVLEAIGSELPEQYRDKAE